MLYFSYVMKYSLRAWFLIVFLEFDDPLMAIELGCGCVVYVAGDDS